MAPIAFDYNIQVGKKKKEDAGLESGWYNPVPGIGGTLGLLGRRRRREVKASETREGARKDSIITSRLRDHPRPAIGVG